MQSVDKLEAVDELKKRRKAFMELLDSSREINTSSSFDKAKSLFELDSRWQAIYNVREREKLFADHLRLLEKRDRMAKSSERRSNMEEFRKVLQGCEWINADSQCRKVFEELRENSVSKKLDDMDRLTVFKEFHRELVLKEEEVEIEKK